MYDHMEYLGRYAYTAEAEIGFREDHAHHAGTTDVFKIHDEGDGTDEYMLILDDPHGHNPDVVVGEDEHPELQRTVQDVLNRTPDGRCWCLLPTKFKRVLALGYMTKIDHPGWPTVDLPESARGAPYVGAPRGMEL